MSTEAWRWGDLFELDVPLAAEVRELGEMIEVRFPEEAETPPRTSIIEACQRYTTQEAPA